MAALGTTYISTTLVRNTLGEDNNDVGLLCSSSLVNMFSKFKPIYHTKTFGLTPTDYQDASYGVIIPSMAAMNSSSNWQYSKPTSSSPKRLGDFSNYFHEAPVALQQVTGNKLEVSPFFGYSYGIGFSILPAPAGMEGYCLTVENLTPAGGSGVLLDNYYLGAALYSGSTLVAEFYSSQKIRYSAGPTQDMDGASIPLVGTLGDPDIEDVPPGNYTLYLFITDAKPIQQVGEPPVYGSFWPIYWNSAYPKNIPTTVYGIDDVYTAQVTGIRPTGDAPWLDGTTGWKDGLIPKEVVGSIAVFDVRVILKNVSGVTTRAASVAMNRLNLNYEELTDWSGSTTSREKTYSASASLITLNNNETAELIFTSCRFAPSTIPDDTVYITHSPAPYLALDTGTSKQIFSLQGVAPTIDLVYDFR